MIVPTPEEQREARIDALLFDAPWYIAKAIAPGPIDDVKLSALSRLVSSPAVDIKPPGHAAARSFDALARQFSRIAGATS